MHTPARPVVRRRWARGRMKREREGACLRVALLLGAALVGVQGAGEQGPLGTRCLRDVLTADGGRVVLYDTVVSVPTKRLFLIGPHKPLWVVQGVPAHSANTVAFHDTFNQRPNADVGSTCRFSLPVADGERGGSSAPSPAAVVSTMAFLPDPISNVNAAYCAIPDAVFALLLRGEGNVRVNVTLVPLDASRPNVTLGGLPVCIADGAGVGVQPPHYAALCCIMKNEARYLDEWIEYSRMIGVEHFYLYDHASDDNTRAVLEGYIAAGIVTLHQWEFDGYPQREAHTHCTHRYAHATAWLGLFDVDEFIVPRRSSSLMPLLSFFDTDSLVVLRLEAAMFGTSGHTERPQGLVLEHYVMRNLTTHWPVTPQHKVWFRPGTGGVLLPSIHAVGMLTGRMYYVMYVCMYGWMDGWMHVCMYVWMD